VTRSATEVERIATPDGRVLTVRRDGDSLGFPILIHHGTPGSSLLYEAHIRDAWAHGIMLLSYDRPGYGGSTRQPGRCVADCAVDVAAICDAFGIDRFCTWGVSGGGPHALATAALLPDRCAAAAALASIGPVDAEGLDFTAGMGEANVESFAATQGSEAEHRAQHELEVASVRDATPETFIAGFHTILGAPDVEVLSGGLVDFTLANMRAGVEPSSDGWFDDDLVFTKPWGFDVGSIHVPVLVWQGEQDLMVPFAHGQWLAAHIPGAEARLTAGDGHLTVLEHQIRDVHAWLVERF
jgi:pimeloyl-ACP methyl ester carboxylesterase